MKIIKVKSCGDCPYILFNCDDPLGFNNNNIILCGENTGIRIAEKSLGKIPNRCPLEDYKEVK